MYHSLTRDHKVYTTTCIYYYTISSFQVETIGDAYMIVSGLPERNGKDHVTQIADTALRLRNAVDTEFTVPHMPDWKLQIRIGLHTG